MEFRRFLFIFVLCFVHECLSKPTQNDLTEGRGIGSTLWSWLTYPFSWWGSSEPELRPVHDQLIGSTPSYYPLDTIEIGRHNVTIWCNDQTCTTQKCDKFMCRNVTCNIYDTDMMGECREYNTISTQEDRVPKPTEPITKPTEKTTEAPTKPSTLVSTTKKDNIVVEEQPLELEAVLSSTVKDKEKDEKESDDKTEPIASEQKI